MSVVVVLALRAPRPRSADGTDPDGRFLPPVAPLYAALLLAARGVPPLWGPNHTLAMLVVVLALRAPRPRSADGTDPDGRFLPPVAPLYAALLLAARGVPPLWGT